MNYTECCRSCLEPDTSSAKLLTDFTVRSLYEDCSRLTVNSLDSLPKKLCSNCYEICNKWREFQEKCRQNEEFLTNLNFNDGKIEIKTEIECLNLEVPEVSEECNDSDLILKSTIVNTVREIKIDEDIEEHRPTNLKTKKIIFKSIRRENVLKDSANQYVCKECGEGFKTEPKLRRHAKDHIPAFPHICNECGEGFKTEPKLRRHAKDHIPAFPHICKECGEGFKTEIKLKSHTKVHITYSCDKCVNSRVFTNKTHFDSHVLHVHTSEDEYKYVCTDCGKRFKLPYLLDRHVKQYHLNELNFICNVCGKRYVSNQRLSVHQRTHITTKPHACHICPQSFKYPTHLKYHILFHTGEKPHKCQYCGKCFRGYNTMKHHVLTHTGERPHVCTVCNRGFIQRTSLKKHLETHDIIA